MKRFLLIFALTITFLGILISASPFILRWSGWDEPLKARLLQKFFPEEQNIALELDNLSIGLNGVVLSKLSYLSDDGRLELLIDAIHVDVNFWNLYRGRQGLHNLISRVRIQKPRLIVHDTRQGDAMGPTEQSPLPDVEINKLLSRLPNVQVVDGKVIWSAQNGTFFSVLQNLNGYLSARDSLLELDGSLLSSAQENFKIKTRYNIRENRFDGDIQLNSYTINRFFTSPISRQFLDDVFVTGGNIDGRLHIYGRFNSLDSLKVNGDIFLENIASRIYGFQTDSLNGHIEFHENRMSVEDGMVYVGRLPFYFTAQIKDILHPELSGDIYNPALDIAYIPTLANLPLDSSQCMLNARYTIGTDFRLHGRLTARRINFAGKPVRDIKMAWQIRDNAIDLTELGFQTLFGRVTGHGRYLWKKQLLAFELGAENVSTENIILDLIEGAKHDVSLQASVNLRTGRIRGGWRYILQRGDTLFHTYGHIRGSEQKLDVVTDYASEPHFNWKARIENYLTNPKISYMAVENFPFHRFTSNYMLRSFRQKVYSSARLSGTINDLRGSLLFRKKATQDTLFSAETHIQNLLHPHKNIDGRLHMGSLQGQYSVDLSPRFLGSYFNLGPGIKGSFFLKHDTVTRISGAITLDRFNIHTITEPNRNDDYRKQAYLDGTLQLSGTLDAPVLQGKVGGNRFIFNGQGYYQPQFVISANRTQVALDSVHIYHNNIPVLNGRLVWTFLNDQIHGRVQGNKVDAETLLKTLGMDSSLVSGEGRYAFSIQGTRLKPFIRADIHLENGKLGGIAFDQLSLNASDRLVRDGVIVRPEDHILEIEDLRINKSGRYHVYGIGTLPVSPEREMDLAIKFDGDIFHYLNRLTPFFRDGASLSDISLKFKGRRNDLRLVAADIYIDRGELWLADVANHVEDISAHVVLRDGSGKVDIKKFAARVDDAYLKIHTERDLPLVDGRKLQNWYFRGLGLDFGVLAMETTSPGVRVHLPGLMYDDEYGVLFLEGRDGAPHFYFAGPVKHPVVFGEVTVSNAQITYPFVTHGTATGPPGPVEEFLAGLDWDVLVRPGKDVVYRRDIPAYVDNVNAELTVDEGSPGLDFSGIIKKGTFHPQGSLVSSRGRLEYLDLNFKVDRFAINFNPNDANPEVAGRAWTTIRDSVGAVPKTIYLQLYAVDPQTGNERQQGSWENFKFKLLSADPTIGETQEQVLAYLGYSAKNISKKATHLGGALTERYLIRPLLRPLEKVLEDNLGIDFVRFNSNIARNLFYSSIGRQGNGSGDAIINPYFTSSSYLYLMSSSEVTLGKYLSENLYLSYTGQLVSVYDNASTGFDFNHSIGLEYRFLKDILIEFEWDRELMRYYNVQNQRQYLEDFKIRFRHSFTF
ncbi:MAG: hypothetical protein D6677_05670 [Calditrichaeota bacterium]|nr:MAG: hypothetical protein D6677_05670 [Calditrichota bacterium]